MFEPFFTTKEVGKGTGLGLSQIHGFAAQAGGRAEIESAEGAGTTLRIILPRTEKTISAPQAERSMVPLPNGLRVLLVEDNPQVRAFAAQLLKDLNCEVVATEDAAGALSELGPNRFDLVFSDVVMPGMNGLDLADEIGRKMPELPVLLTTGYSDRLAGKDSRRHLILAKPYDATSLSEAITLVLEPGDAVRNSAA